MMTGHWEALGPSESEDFTLDLGMRRGEPWRADAAVRPFSNGRTLVTVSRRYGEKDDWTIEGFDAAVRPFSNGRTLVTVSRRYGEKDDWTIEGFVELVPDKDGSGYVFVKAGPLESSIRAKDMINGMHPEAFDELSALVRLRSL